MHTMIKKFEGAGELVRVAWEAYSRGSRVQMSRSIKKWILFLVENQMRKLTAPSVEVILKFLGKCSKN